MHFTAILCGQFSQRFVKFSQRIHAWREALPSDKFPHRLLAPKLRYSRAVCKAKISTYFNFNISVFIILLATQASWPTDVCLLRGGF